MKWRPPLRLAPLGIVVVLTMTWLVSGIAWIGLNSRDNENGTSLWFRQGNVCVLYYPGSGDVPHKPRLIASPVELEVPEIAGAFEFSHPGEGGYWYIQCPMLVLLTLFVPLSICYLNRFRLPLWVWFGWTALVAAECGYYLR